VCKRPLFLRLAGGGALILVGRPVEVVSDAERHGVSGAIQVRPAMQR